VKLATKNQEHTSHNTQSITKKQQQIFLNYKAPQNTNQKQIFEKEE
jgi:hypothetical protein